MFCSAVKLLNCRLILSSRTVIRFSNYTNSIADYRHKSLRLSAQCVPYLYIYLCSVYLEFFIKTEVFSKVVRCGGGARCRRVRGSGGGGRVEFPRAASDKLFIIIMVIHESRDMYVVRDTSCR